MRENFAQEDDEPDGLAVEFGPGSGHDLWRAAGGVLRRNDMGGWTKAAPELYPHQWSWDSAFIAIGWAHLDARRAAAEIKSLFASQWHTGKVPHIVYNRDAPAGSYFPGPEHWASACASPEAPPTVPYTSALCQPPVHAVAVREVWRAAREGEPDFAREFLQGIYPGLLRWHRYLLTARDPEGSGLVSIYHPWESGTDNSPRWEGALERIAVGEVPAYRRLDLGHGVAAEERPTDLEYDRYLWLVESIKRADCDEDTLNRSHPFLVKDVLASAILVAANEALAEMAGVLGAPEEERAEIERWALLGRKGLDSCWDEKLGLCLDYDLRRDEPLRARTVAGFAPLVCGGLTPERQRALVETLLSRHFLGHPGLHRALPPSTSPAEELFDPRSYWRGPVWPVICWLLWWSLRRAGEPEVAARLRSEGLRQLVEGGFAEYFEPFTGEPLGSRDQSWTAAVALDWLAGG